MKCLNSKIDLTFDHRVIVESRPAAFTAEFTEEIVGGCRIGRLSVHISRQGAWDSMGLAVDAPVKLDITMDEMPDKMVCMYLFKDWWTRPAFVDASTAIPSRTQVMYSRFKNHYACVLPLVGKVFKATLTASEDSHKLRFQLDAGVGGLRDLEEEVYIIAEGDSVGEAVAKAFRLLHERQGLKLRQERALPKMLQYLGWCSWDAFYKNISEEKLRQKAAEFSEKQVPVRWMIFDDGWMQSSNDMLCAFEPDPEKFPEGFGPLTAELRAGRAGTDVSAPSPVAAGTTSPAAGTTSSTGATNGITWFGVWHALGGYWAGVDPASALASVECEHLDMTRNGRLVPSTTTGAAFYENWYRLLRQQGIDFVKVDGQSSLPVYFRNDRPFPGAARELSRELEQAVAIMDGSIINCMGMAMENVTVRPFTGVSRNSDDFFPRREGSFAEHLLENAYNAIYHNQIYYCDWDMFWTQHPDAEKHGLIRAISGGPVYFSDEIGKTDPILARKFCTFDGKLLMLDRSAMTAEDSIFKDPLREGVLKIQNVGTVARAKEAGETGADMELPSYREGLNSSKVGVVALFNLTDKEQPASVSVKDVPELDPSRSYWLVDYYAKTAEVLRGTAEDAPAETSDEESPFVRVLSETKYMVLAPGDYKYFVLLPYEECSCLGLTEKFTGFLAVKGASRTEGTWRFSVAETGSVAFLAERKVQSVTINGINRTSDVTSRRYFHEITVEPSEDAMTVEVWV